VYNVPSFQKLHCTEVDEYINTLTIARLPATWQLQSVTALKKPQWLKEPLVSDESLESILHLVTPHWVTHNDANLPASLPSFSLETYSAKHTQSLGAQSPSAVTISRFSPTQKNFDLLSVIQWKIRLSLVQWYGHQDNLEQSLDHWEILNVKMDSTAKAFWNFLKESYYCGPIQLAISNGQWSIWKGQEKLSQADHAMLYDFI
jgi:hypothetical protein